MTAHIGQLTEWYESAERITKTNLPGDGDFIIYPHRRRYRDTRPLGTAVTRRSARLPETRLSSHPRHQ